MKIFFDSVGCRLNQSEVERLGNIFRALGHHIVGEASQADLAVVNTCAVTVKAAADSRKKLRRAARKGAKQVIAIGCWASLYPDRAIALKGVTGVISNSEKDFLASKVLDIPVEEVSKLKLTRVPLPGDRARTRAFIKVQEGCDGHCTYCLTRVARGRSQSRCLEAIRRDIRAALAGDAKEVVLTGVQLGAWGRDFESPARLDQLIAAVMSMAGVQRVRLSSIEPWDFKPSYLNLWGDKRLCRHLHIPLQSADDRILRAMRRPITREKYANLISLIRNAVPDIAITTDVIVGFPGETEDAFEATRAFIKQMDFAGGHVFSFSPRQGTAAYEMKDRVPIQVAKARNAELRRLFKENGWNYLDGFIGRHAEVLWESSKKNQDSTWSLSGLTDNYIRVYAEGARDLWNEISPVDLAEHKPGRQALLANIVKH